MTTPLGLTNDELKISVEIVPDGWRVAWTGRSNAREPQSFLVPYLDQLAEQLRDARVALDFRLFEYMNSSTVMPIVRFIQRLDATCSHVTVVYDASRSWQRMSFAAVKAVSALLKNVKVVDSVPSHG